MSQVHVCAYCYLIQREDREDHEGITPKDVQVYLVHLRIKHGVTLGPEIEA